MNHLPFPADSINHLFLFSCYLCNLTSKSPYAKGLSFAAKRKYKGLAAGLIE